MVYLALLPLMRTPRLPVVDWTDVPANINGLVRFARKTKSGFCACAITFQPASTNHMSLFFAWTPIILLCLDKFYMFHSLTPNDHYSGRTAPLTPIRWILCIYSTNIGTEYFKHDMYSPFFSLQNAVCFIIITYLVPVLFTFYIQSVLKF